MSEKLLKTNQHMGRKDAAAKIHELAEKISEGKVELRSGDEHLSLEPSEQVEFELEVEREQDGDISIEVEVEWNTEDEEGGVEIK